MLSRVSSFMRLQSKIGMASDSVGLMVRDPFHVNPALTKTAKCIVCGASLFSNGSDASVCYRPCGLLFAAEDVIAAGEMEATCVQLLDTLHGVPSRIKVPSWPDVFARPEFAKEPVLTKIDARVPAHLCARNCQADALAIVLRKWPHSARTVTFKVQRTVLLLDFIGCV